MLPKEETKNRRTKFWTELDSEMKSVKGIHGNKVNWLGYRSHVKELFIRMEFDGKGARLCIDLQHRDDSIRALFYEQFTELKTVMQDCFSNELIFLSEFKIESSGIFCSRIKSENTDLNFYHDEDLKLGIDFFKEQLISLDKFWDDYKDIFIALAQ